MNSQQSSPRPQAVSMATTSPSTATLSPANLNPPILVEQPKNVNLKKSRWKLSADGRLWLTINVLRYMMNAYSIFENLCCFSFVKSGFYCENNILQGKLFIQNLKKKSENYYLTKARQIFWNTEPEAVLNWVHQNHAMSNKMLEIDKQSEVYKYNIIGFGQNIIYW